MLKSSVHNKKIDQENQMQNGLKRINKKELGDLKIILLSEGLPVQTIGSAPISFFSINAENGAPLGWGGIEIYNDAGVLRSVVIKNALRGMGSGKKLVKALISEARDLGLKKLWLLTINAETFFSRLGFQHAIRSEAPKAIQQCEEFTWGYNDTAHCMCLKLKPACE